MRLRPAHKLSFTKILVAATVVFVVVASVFLITYIRRTDIHGAIRSGDVERVKEMLARRPNLINIEEDMGSNILHTAATVGRADIVRLLLERRINPDPVNWHSVSPLHLASGHGHVEVVSILLKYDANPNRKNNQSDTPLHLAADAGNLEVARMLIEAGANVNAIDYRNQTPLDRARDRGRSNIIEVLSKYEAKE